MNLAEVRQALVKRVGKSVKTVFATKQPPYKKNRWQFNKEIHISNNKKSQDKYMSAELNQEHFSTFIVANQITPLGCRCNVLLLSRHLQKLSAVESSKYCDNNNSNATNNNANNNNANNNNNNAEAKESLQSLSAHEAENVITICAKQKVMLSELAPRDIINIRGNYFNSIIRNKCLPKEIPYKRVFRRHAKRDYGNMRNSHNTEEQELSQVEMQGWANENNNNINNNNSRNNNNSSSSILVNCHEVCDCPWNALSLSMSSAVKHKVLKRYMENALSTFTKGNNNSNNNNSKECNSSNLVSCTTMRYNEPLTIPVLPNRLQEINYVFVKRESDNRQSSNNEHKEMSNNFANEKKESGYFVAASLAYHNSSTINNNNYCCNKNDAIHTKCDKSQIHPLMTLEQKRLLIALNAWVANVPFYIQQMLHSVNVHQYAHVPSKRPWDASLIVTLCVAKHDKWNNKSGSITKSHGSLFCDDDSSVNRNPLNSSAMHEGTFAHSHETLSAEEQRLLHFVLNATPLIKHVELHLLNLSTLHWEKLHPTILRSSWSSSSSLSFHNFNSYHNMIMTSYLPEVVQYTHQHLFNHFNKGEVANTTYPPTMIKIDCIECAKPFVINVPALSSTLYRHVLHAHGSEEFADKLTLGGKSSKNNNNIKKSIHEKINELLVHKYVYTLPFWRQYESLSETCSLLLSLALEPFTSTPVLESSISNNNNSNSNDNSSNTTANTINQQQQRIVRHVLLYSGEATKLQVATRKYEYCAQMADPITGHVKLLDVLRYALNTIAHSNTQEIHLETISGVNKNEQLLHSLIHRYVTNSCNVNTKKTTTVLHEQEEEHQDNKFVEEVDSTSKSEQHALICICCLSGDANDEIVISTLLTECIIQYVTTTINDKRNVNSNSSSSDDKGTVNISKHIRFVLMECSVELQFNLLRDALTKVMQKSMESAHKQSNVSNESGNYRTQIIVKQMHSGIVNVDHLSSSMIGYCICDMILQ